jgi:hypothetical protein
MTLLQDRPSLTRPVAVADRRTYLSAGRGGGPTGGPWLHLLRPAQPGGTWVCGGEWAWPEPEMSGHEGRGGRAL